MCMKRCSLCNQKKPYGEFNRHKGRKDGYYERCKECRKIEHIQRYADPENRKRAKQRMKERYWSDPESRRKYNNQNAYKTKVKAINVLGGKCMRCGFDHPAALQFHHRDPSTKEFNLSHGASLGKPKKFPWPTILEEIKKCDLLCSNCHFIEHSSWSELMEEE